MVEVYEKVIGMVEEQEVCEKTDELLSGLGREMGGAQRRCCALLEAARFLVVDPDTDTSALGRLIRLADIFPEEAGEERAQFLLKQFWRDVETGAGMPVSA